ncbi:MAG: ATP synthase F1 subunit gamma [Tepidanaerobacteraceae bacterium]|nr:ATP synthase F1 subunit gamma [Tepidanaerobacteraceae bacterium]
MTGMREIKRRISSVNSMRKITGAMFMVSSARLKDAQKRVQNFGDFFDRTADIIAGMPYSLKHKEKRSPIFIVMAGDRGLAGGYNEYVLKTAFQKIEKYGAAGIITVGMKAKKFFLNMGKEPILWYDGMNKEMPEEAIEEICRRILDEYKRDSFVYAVYTHFISPAVQQVRVARLLPPENRDLKQNLDYIFEPSPEELMNMAMKFHVKISLYGFYLHSYASEQAYRMKAMENATHSADELLENLNMKFHRERKAIITQEISEIVSGAEEYLH